MEPQIIKTAVSDYFKVPVFYMEHKSRKRPFTVARHFAMSLMKKYTGLSLLDIATQFNRINHTSVIHAKLNVENLVETKRIYRKAWNDLEKTISAKENEEDLIRRYNRSGVKLDNFYDWEVRQRA